MATSRRSSTPPTRWWSRRAPLPRSSSPPSNAPPPRAPAASKLPPSARSTSRWTATCSTPIPPPPALETGRIGGDVVAVAAHSDYLLDNISNTLDVAAGDADVAKRLFVFLGVPGGLLAAMLAAYSGTVLAEAQRREQAMLRVRGAARRTCCACSHCAPAH